MQNFPNSAPSFFSFIVCNAPRSPSRDAFASYEILTAVTFVTFTFVMIFCRTFVRASAIDEALTVVTLCAGYFAPGESSSHFTRYVAITYSSFFP